MSELRTTITAVVIYPDRARVTRSGAATLEVGVQRLEVHELPPTLDPASVRASARGTARARLLGVDVQRAFYSETPTERVRDLEGQLEALQDEMAALDARLTLLKEERESLRGLARASEAYARGLAYGKTTAADQMALLERLRLRAEEVDGALLELGVQRREMERRLAKLQRELEQLHGARGRERYTAVVEVDVQQAGDLTVELVGMVTNAGWTPLYDLRLLEGEQISLEVGYLAQVTQRSGEDWADVALALSTARPALAATIPELKPWYIGMPLPPPAPPQARAMKMHAAMAPAPAAETMAPGAGMVEEPAQALAEEVTATVDTSGTAVTYLVPGTVTVPTDGAPHKVTVARYALEPKLDYVSAPKLVAAAYRRAQVNNDSPYTLLPGAVNLFAGEEFIGATRLELTAPGGELELYLGVDDRVRVERELKRRDVDKKFIGDRRRLVYGYEIKLKNLLPVEASVTLHDQVPVPRHEEIKVRLELAEPKPIEQSELGLLRWQLLLKPGEERKVRFDLTVEHPRNMPVSGLP